MFERFTDRARRVLVLAQEETRTSTMSFIDTRHLLAGLLREGEGIGAKSLIAADIKVEDIQATYAAPGEAPVGSPPFTPEVKKCLEYGLRQALEFGHSYIGTEHLLLAMIRVPETDDLFSTLNVNKIGLRTLTLEMMGFPPSPQKCPHVFERVTPSGIGIAISKNNFCPSCGEALIS